jgi:hypothetical protein
MRTVVIARVPEPLIRSNVMLRIILQVANANLFLQAAILLSQHYHLVRHLFEQLLG